MLLQDTFSKEDKKNCIFCDGEHKPYECEKVKNVDERKKILKEKRCCYKCIRFGHNSRDCRSKLKCFNCTGYHHAAVCYKSQAKMSNPNQDGKLTTVAGIKPKQFSTFTNCFDYYFLYNLEDEFNLPNFIR